MNLTPNSTLGYKKLGETCPPVADAHSVTVINAGAGNARVLLLGGTPFTEELVMWWNFIGRSHEEIVDFRERWNAEDPQFGRVEGYDGDRLLAPPMPNTRLKSRPRHR